MAPVEEGTPLGGGVMVVLGDSVAQGEGDPDPEGGWIGWARRLAALLDIRADCVHNASQQGATMNYVVSNQLPRVEDLRPSLVVLGCGMNDALRGFRLEGVLGDLASVFRWAQNAVAVTVAVPVPCPPLLQTLPVARRNEVLKRIDVVNLVLQQQAGKYRAICPPQDICRHIADPGLWCNDGIHLNPRGHAVMAKVLANLIGARLSTADHPPSGPEEASR